MNTQPESTVQSKIPFFSQLQVKYAMSYLAILAVVLVLLNTYPLIASQDLLFSSKRDSLKNQSAVMSSALMELETLTPDQVTRVMNLLDNVEMERIIVTDASGLILYDSLIQSAEGKTPSDPDASPAFQYALFQEVVFALQGNDVFYSQYQDGVFRSTAASPIIYRGMTIGSIYIYDQDDTQGALLMSLQQNLRTISLVLAVIAISISVLFSHLLTLRIGALLGAIRVVGEGEYGHRLQPAGNDELAHLAEEFNQLTDRLQTTEEVRRRFVSDASHELKTPLASICLLTDSILQNQTMDPETVRDFVTDIGEEAQRLTRITEHLLALTRLDSLPAGQTHVVDLAAVAQRAVSMLAPVADASNVTLELSCKPGCTLRCTQDDLYQICFNLIENAIKYNLPGGQVFISVRHEGDQVLLEVADTGIGIPEDELSKVFNRFYRVDKARSRAAGGTGLGLSIVRDTIRRHGGWITAQCRQPCGSIFTAGFPCETPDVGGDDL